MEQVCHRCSATVEPDSFYCQNCGAPQIRYVAQEQAEEASAADPSSHALGSRHADGATSVQWSPAIRIAAAVALAVGVLSTLLAAGSVLWVAVGAVIVIGIYHRRHPRTLLGRRAGARIGALVGLLAASIAMAGNALFLLVQRYWLHQGGEIDAQLTTIVQQAAERAGAMDPQAPVATFTSFWLSAEGRIGLILLTMGFLAALIVLFAVAGGILGAQIYRSPRGSKATP